MTSELKKKISHIIDDLKEPSQLTGESQENHAGKYMSKIVVNKFEVITTNYLVYLTKTYFWFRTSKPRER